MNGEAGELGAAGTAPEAQPSSSYCVTQHALPTLTLPAQLQPAACFSPSRMCAMRPLSTRQCIMPHSLCRYLGASCRMRSAHTLMPGQARS